MNETTKAALEQFVMKMLDVVEQHATWTAEQAPLVVQEWLRWQMINAVIEASPALVASIAAVCGCRWLLRRARWYADHSEFNTGGEAVDLQFGAVLVGSLAVMLFSMFLFLASPALKVYLAPRVVILEKFADLLK